MLSILCVRLTIKVKVGIPESFKVGWYPPKKTGSSHLKSIPLFRTCQKESTYIRAQLETYCILFEFEQNIQRFFNATSSADLSDIEIPVFLFNLCLSSYSTVFY